MNDVKTSDLLKVLYEFGRQLRREPLISTKNDGVSCIVGRCEGVKLEGVPTNKGG